MSAFDRERFIQEAAIARMATGYWSDDIDDKMIAKLGEVFDRIRRAEDEHRRAKGRPAPTSAPSRGTGIPR